MPIGINGSGTITGISAGGLPDNVIVADDIAAGAVAPAKLSTGAPSWDSSGNLQFNSGYGSVATAYGCRAWVNFNGTGTIAIYGSGNVSSITDGGAGIYTVNFSTALVDANYSAVFSFGTNLNSSRLGVISDGGQAAGSFKFQLSNQPDTANTDSSLCNVAVFR